VAPDLGSSNHQPLPPEGGKMTKNEIVKTTQQDEIKNVPRTLNAL
jgi:hypothetical protein